MFCLSFLLCFFVGSSMTTSPGTPRFRSTKHISINVSSSKANTIGNSKFTVLPQNGTEFLSLFEEYLASLKFPFKKKTYDVRHRLLFVAGLEGTGHHGLHEVFGVCVESKLCDGAQEISRTLQIWRNWGMHGLFSGADAVQAHDQVRKVFDLMKAITKQTREEREAVVHIIGLDFSGKADLGAGMMSYPNGPGPNKPIDYPDIAMLAFISEMVGIDLRVLILQRPAIEVIASTKNRDFGGAIQSRILISNAQALYTQMAMIDPSFYHCLDYHTLGNMTEAHQLAFRHFVHPDIDDELLKQMLSKIRYQPPFNITKNLHLKQIQYDIVQLQMRMDLMNNMCQSHGRNLYGNLRLDNA